MLHGSGTPQMRLNPPGTCVQGGQKAVLRRLVNPDEGYTNATKDSSVLRLHEVHMQLKVLNFFDFFEVEKLRDTPLVMNVAFRKSDCFHVFGGQSDFLPFSMMVAFIVWGS